MKYNPKQFAVSLLNHGNAKINEHNFAHMFAEIKSILSLSPESEKKYAFVTDLRSCFDKRVALEKAHIRYDKANIVLTEYYKSGKILDYIEKIQNFTDNTDTEKEPSYIAERGYNNYVYFLRLFTEELKTKYNNSTSFEDKTAYEHNPKNLCRFIKNDCRDITVIQDLATAYEQCLIIQKKLDSRQKIEPEDQTAYRHISDVMDFTKCCKGKKTDFVNQKLDSLSQTFEEKTMELSINSDKGELLYFLICSSLTDEWFDMLNPQKENNPINTMTSAQIKELYIKSIDRIKCITDKYKREGE